ncbi:hypothetical protein BJX99DRAFT_224109 [Aspergillus californicus]
MDHGLEIWMHKLNSFKIAEDGETATFGGGIQSGDVIQLLWAEGKQTGEPTVSFNVDRANDVVSGVCECTSYLGPGLGGGHGALQGRFGLLSDQFVSMHVAMADGEIHHISESEDSDLWWAMQGAGHNFGIVTSITSKIHDVPDNGLWGYELLYFTGDLVEKLADLFNELAEYQPPDFLIWTYILHNPELDGENPVIMANFIQRNVTNIECELIDSFRDLSPDAPLVAQAGLYTDIPRWIDTQRGGRGCARDSFKVRFPIGFPRYNRDALREFYDKFAEATSGSSPFNTSMVLLEQYSTQGVKAIPEDSTAFPHRQDDLLLSPVITWTSTDEETENEAIALGDTLREILHEKSGSEELHAYVNYAAGNEGPKNWYGYEPWRLEKLQELKRKYDPDAKFSYYAPVP